MIAYWNGMTWECSPSLIARLDSLSTSFSMQTETNADKEGVSPTETVGLNEVEVSFSTTYHIETGTSDIKRVISEWKSKIGKAAPLIIGSEIFGPDRMQLQSVGVSKVGMRANGLFTEATLSFKFKEFIEEPAVASVSNTRGTGAGNTASESAVSVSASSADKEAKKPVTVNFNHIQKNDTRSQISNMKNVSFGSGLQSVTAGNRIQNAIDNLKKS